MAIKPHLHRSAALQARQIEDSKNYDKQTDGCRVRYTEISTDQVSSVLPHIQQLVETTYREDGCIAYDVAEDVSDRPVRFSELWPDSDSLDKHLQAPHIEPWREVARRHGLVERNVYRV